MTANTIDLHVWLIEAVDSDEAREACRAMLSANERQRADRFVFERHRREFIHAHGMLRLALSQAAPDVAPSDWSFATGPHGRPYVAGPARPMALHFNLTHTEGCVACVVSGHEAVGVDVEQITPRRARMETAEGVFSPDELASLRDIATDQFVSRFFDYWTLKEAYLKARGIGLHLLPLDRFSMRLGADGVGIHFDPEIDDDPRKWRFTQSSPSPVHRLAVADGSGVAGGLAIRTHSPLPPRPGAPG
ncbi:4'-phosphopantetheinyl transferase superfamily protein [Bradyrhizobium manausense]|uniref:4'-phosphopantetheinyl transferase family protein n=1 Tax=Bradyrhizobium TaxID=374 RepID=UPI001BA90CB6|nr:MULTISPECIES: 4'-phosphopantetheinyl transferase superfamily protein [Bradyrhizobium]MBR0831013.1 4'-phosphopantetheinyl transferase superfamily protein [Bradyrhizobium manausense]UVO30808.1 4'-phosphopantetheinyl transferase superfamily protein [Bradyrhizobium arachidis]